MQKETDNKIVRVVTIYESNGGYSYVDETFDGDTRRAVLSEESFNDPDEALIDAAFSANDEVPEQSDESFDVSDESKPF